MEDAEAVELHAAAGLVGISQSVRCTYYDDLIKRMTHAQSHESIILYPAQSRSPHANKAATET